MINKPLESDWKTFRKRVPEWRERYLARQNQLIAALFAEGKKTPTEQFWEAEKKIKGVARILVDCLDGHSRSKMEMYLCLMVRHKMIGADDLEEFSGEMKVRILLIVGPISG
ncbi:hypothetical protein DSOUD_1559 [Desulfuromonas soudanensis]|uniref:Uncharacterized protein n=1 Tax=Desulfuromonas soudanensis TaxID=1603606 RepID=A0A0M4D260_9BACT|nr:hypothetical protein [Desulfuromonas soudanensis]ALC16338.1 hypothetical protein DSOUD_1559 [Desulfuromonas soudanensis]